MATDNRVNFQVNLPALLTERIGGVAESEGISTDKLVEDALERELLMRRHKALQRWGQANAAATGFTEADVARFIAESRPEPRRT